MMTRLTRWCRYRRWLRAEVSRRQYLGYPVSRERYGELCQEARQRAGYGDPGSSVPVQDDVAGDGRAH